MADTLASRVRTITKTATAALTSGTFCEEGGIMGVPMADAAIGAAVAIAVEGEVWLPITGGSAGDLLYWTGTALTLTPTGNSVIGKLLTDSQTSGRHNGYAKVLLLNLQGSVVG